MELSNKIRIFLVGFLLLGLIGGLNSCRSRTPDENVAYYTCPMHPQIRQDSPGQCPICGMDLVPVVKSEPGSGHSHPEAGGEGTEGSGVGSGAAPIKIDPMRLQRIGVVTDTVKLRELTKELLIQGKVAHDPKLWVAEKEYLIALRLGERDLIRSSEEKLRFLGLSPEWIAVIKKRRKADLGLHIPVPGQPSLLEAFINQSDLKEIHVGQRVEIYDLHNRLLGKGSVIALGTLLSMESRTLRVLVQSDSYLDLPSNTFVQFKIAMNLGERLAVPKAAVLFNGDHNMVYVETSPGEFQGKTVELGAMAGNYYEVEGGLVSGERVVVNGHFLLDSETQMRMGTMGGHQHGGDETK